MAEFLKEGSRATEPGVPDAVVPDDAPRRVAAWPDPLGNVQAEGPWLRSQQVAPPATWWQWMAMARAGRWTAWQDSVARHKAPWPDLQQADQDHATLLSLAARDGALEAVKVLLKAGAAVDQSGVEGHRPLALAARGGHTPVVRALLQAGAEPEAAGAQGQQAMHLAASQGQVAAMQLLKQAGASPLRCNLAGRHVLSEAALWGQREAAQWLVAQAVPVDQPDCAGLNVLHAAALGGDMTMVGWLRAQGLPVPSRITQVLLEQLPRPISNQ
jgi:ankyrin repeat protein